MASNCSRRIRTGRQWDQCYIIRLTGLGSAIEITEALAAGVDGHLTKPLDAGKLRNRLNSVRRLPAAKTVPAQTLNAPLVDNAT
jgi:DNA-binding response OmpR family regulator